MSGGSQVEDRRLGHWGPAWILGRGRLWSSACRMGDPERVRAPLGDGGRRPLRVSVWTWASRWSDPACTRSPPHRRGAGHRSMHAGRWRGPGSKPSVAPTLKTVPQLRPFSSSSHPPVCPACGALDTKPAPSGGSGCALRPKVLILLHQTPGQGQTAVLTGPPPKAPGSGQQEKWGFPEGAGRPHPAASAHCGVFLGQCPSPLPSTPCTQGESMSASDRGQGWARRHRVFRTGYRTVPAPLAGAVSCAQCSPQAPVRGPSPVGVGCSF